MKIEKLKIEKAEAGRGMQRQAAAGRPRYLRLLVHCRRAQIWMCTRRPWFVPPEVRWARLLFFPSEIFNCATTPVGGTVQPLWLKQFCNARWPSQKLVQHSRRIKDIVAMRFGCKQTQVQCSRCDKKYAMPVGPARKILVQHRRHIQEITAMRFGCKQN